MHRRKKSSKLSVFSISAIDLFASTTGAFIVIVVMLVPRLNLSKSGSSDLVIEEVAGEKFISSLELYKSKIKSGQKFTMKNIHFIGDADKFLPGAEEQIEILANKLKENPRLKLHIVGHTNSWDPIRKKRIPESVVRKEKLEKLSLARAKRVKDELVDRGINSLRISVEGKGSEEMLFPRGTIEQVIYNRRVEVLFL